MGTINVTFSDAGQWSVNEPDGSVVTYNSGDIAFALSGTALVFIMSPGVGFLYSGLLRRKNALNQIFLALAAYAVVTFTWFFWGYSLAFSEDGGPFIGNLKHFGLMGVLEQESVGSTHLPALAYCVYQLMFAAITPVLALGATAERGRVAPALVWTFLWTTIVYSPVANWYWNPNGWVYIMGGLDFAGGGPVHMSSGSAALAYTLYLGKRRGYGTDSLNFRPNSVTNVVIGTVLLWFGWFGFNGGSALAADLRAVQACVVTNMAAACGAITWCLIDFWFERRWSVVGFCSGAVSGLIGITPAAGYVGTPAALAIGVLAGVGCNFATKLKFIFRLDDSLDIGATHLCGGFIGALLTGLFADSRVTAFDGSVISGGWINHNYRQLGLQIASSVATIAYCFVMSFILLIIVDHIPGLSLRVPEIGEIVGLDEYEHGEYTFDFVHFSRDLEVGDDAHKEEVDSARQKMKAEFGERGEGGRAAEERIAANGDSPKESSTEPKVAPASESSV